MYSIIVKFLRRMLLPAVLFAIPGATLRNKFIALVKRELYAHTSPGKLAGSLAIGVFMAIFPVHGLQVVFALALSLLFRLNRPVTMVGVSVSSAPLLPFWIGAGVAVGMLCIPAEAARSMAVSIEPHLPGWLSTWMGKLPIPGLLDGVVRWFFGSVILAVACGAGTFAVAYPLIVKVQESAGEGRS